MEQIDKVWFAIVNPHAGAGKTAAEWTKAEEALRRRGVDYRYKMTDCKFHATEIAFGAAEEGYRRFIAVGGDGTVHEVLDGIMQSIGNASVRGEKTELSKFSLAVIPIGSGNDWIKSHNLSHDTRETIDLIADNSFVLQDVVKVSFLAAGSGDVPVKCSYMVNIGGIGFDARVCERVNARKDAGKSGKLLYINSLIYHLFRCGHFGVRVECDGSTVFEGACYSIALGTGRYSGGGLRQTPEAVTDDGLTDVTIIPPLSPGKILREAYKLFNGKILTVGELTAVRAKSVKVVPLGGDSEPVEVDGEIVGKIPVRFDVLPDRINVLHKK